MRNERGITLVELLGALVLVAILSVFIITLVVNTEGNAERQQTEALQTRSMTFALNTITTDVRKNPDQITAANGTLTIPSGNTTITYTLNADSGELLKNSTVVARGVTGFVPSLDDQTLTVTIVDTKEKEWKTQIVLRKGADL